MKDHSLAKLCAQCEEYYTELRKMMDQETVSLSFNKDWKSIVKIICLKIFYKYCYH